MDQIGGVAGYTGNFWYNQGAGASEGNQETDFQELVYNQGGGSRKDTGSVETGGKEYGKRPGRPGVILRTYDYFGRVQNREPMFGMRVNILA